MTNVSHRRVKQVREEVRIPGTEYGGWGATADDVSVAISLLANRWTEIHGEKPKYGDWYRVWAADDAVVLFFLTEEEVE